MPLITITHSIGCDGLAVARRVAEDLNVGLYDDPKLKEEAIRMGLDVQKLERSPQASAWFNRLMGEKPEVYANLMGSVIYETARSGEGVIMGHGSQMLLQDFSCAMHVLVTATKERRISNLTKLMNLSREAAEKVVHKSDNQNKEFFQYVFHRDWDDPSLYDLCVNPGKIGIERASQTIVETAGYSELKACNIYALDAIERLSQTKRIEASLSELDLKPPGLMVEVPEKGLVHISGILLNYEDKERIPKVVRGIPGVERIDMDVMVMPTEYGQNCASRICANNSRPGKPNMMGVIMNLIDYYEGMEMELISWKAKMYDLKRKIETIGSKESEKVLPNIQDLTILITEMSF